MPLLHTIPIGLTLIRALLGPVVFTVAWLAPNHAVFATCLLLAFLSDVFDGIIARRLKIATEGIRRLDSIADSIFYLCAALAAYRLYPAAIHERILPLAILLLLELGRYLFDYLKYRKETSYHMWSSKLWGIFLFAGFMSLLGFGQPGILVSLAIYVGIFADIEGLLISLTLQHWRHDVPTIFHALAIRREQTAPVSDATRL